MSVGGYTDGRVYWRESNALKQIILWYAHVPFVRSFNTREIKYTEREHVKSNRSKIFNDDIFYMQMKFNERKRIKDYHIGYVSFHSLSLSLFCIRLIRSQFAVKRILN